ncbi:O-antigen/teichoic acid export membrane protein [Microbacterium sp. W4I4]|uniref:lipopolysaccharide biosynthesis protein n=1 Tax=Microbacterium sp. W4I4 TaxID=3042295 RepID=UPI0027841859|nr:oligosaccharide flippase family protein [Microbacterium sp. W4I4]MDQ0613317.1 O-antigen/teichoic acid export membrane protein [Microbacterium sp. W4I4]
MRRIITNLARAEVVRNAVTLISGTAIGQLAMLMAMPILARLFTAEQFGAFTIYSSVAGVLAVVVALRYDVAIVLPEKDSDARLLGLLSCAIALIISVIAALILLVIAPGIAEATGAADLRWLLPFAALGGFLLALVSIFSFWFNRRGRYGRISGGRVTMMIGTAGGQVGLGLTAVGAVGLVGGGLIGQSAAVASLSLPLRRGIRVLARQVRRSPRDHWAQALRLMNLYRRMPLLNGPTALIDALRISAVNFTIGLVSVSALGLFGMAWKLLEIPSFLLGNAMSQLVLQRLAGTDRVARYRFMVSATLGCAAVGIIPFGLIYLLAPWLIPWFLGAQYAESAGYAQALVPWVYLSFLAVAMAPFYLVTERQWIPLVISTLYLGGAVGTFLLLRGDVLHAVTMVSVLTAVLLGFQIVLGVVLAHHDARSG